jgi:methionyl-tRNA formyltransferase
VSAVAVPPGAPLRVLFAGTPEVALPSLELLLADPRVTVAGVLTNPDRPQGRSRTPRRSAVAELAHERGLPLLQPARPVDAEDAIRALAVDIGAVVAYGAILPRPVLALPRLGFINLHFSLLPRWRGAAPVQHAIAAMDRSTGVSVFRLEAGMDTGPLLRQRSVPLRSDRDAGEVLAELAELGAPLLLEGLLALAAGEEASPQPDTGVTLAPKLRPADAELDWKLPAPVLAARIRSLTPRPGASTSLRGQRVKVASPMLVDEAELAALRTAGWDAGPGCILAVGPSILVACGSGALRLGRLQAEGRRWVDAQEFSSGQRIVIGETFDA